MLVLPASPARLPELPTAVTAKVLADQGQPLQHIRHTLAELPAPASLVGALSTPAAWWVAALQQWPKAEVWLWDESAQPPQWCRFGNAEPAPGPKTQARLATTHAGGDMPNAAAHIRDLQKRAFLLAVWGTNDKSREHELDTIRLQAAGLGHECVSKVNHSIALGKKGFATWQECEQQLRALGDGPAFEQWYQPWLAEHHHKIQHHLGIMLSKQRKFMASKQHTHQPLHSQLQMPDCSDHHPNSLLHLKPQPFWEVVIDETGSQFGQDATDIPLASPDLGRVVALAVPGKQAVLPEIGQHHATEQSHQHNDTLVQRLLEAPVGILGFTVKDKDILHAYSWLSAIHTLCRWVLRHLPMHTGQPVRVDFLIEQRGNAGADLAAVAELLMAELHSLNAERFANVKVNMAFINKSGHRYNGYVDTIAHTWGSQAAASKDRLKKSAWLEHCLLRPTDETLSRLLLAMDGEPLSGHDWLALMGQLKELPEHSLAQNSLQRLGEQVAQEPGLWQQYVTHISQELAGKHYRLTELVPALNWLQQYTPAGHALPATLELQWLAGKLAVANHLGQLNMEMVARCFALSEQLKEEDARLVAEVLLRLVVSATNSYQFELAGQVLDHLEQLSAVALGLQNQGKLLSSRGQVLAFMGQHAEATSYFEKALAVFARLSDPSLAHREQAQTGLYRLFTLLDDTAVSDADWVREAELYTQAHLGKDLPATLRALAYSQEPQRWLHHLLLRAMCLRPGLAADYVIHYVQQEHQWQAGDYHPWPLIGFYRGWLLHQLGREQDARKHWQHALACCAQGGATLQWMGQVLTNLVMSLGGQAVPLNEEQLQRLHRQIPALPLATLQALDASASHEQRGQYLAECLPFNFH